MRSITYPTAFTLWGPEEREAIARVIASDRFTSAAEVRAAERELAAYHGRRHAVFTNSGSSANLVAVEALLHLARSPLQRGDLALVPALAWSTTYAPLVQKRLHLRLVDCDDTWNAPTSCEVLMRTIPRPQVPRLLVVASILGNPGYLEAWEELARQLDAYLIEDNCESIGARTPGGRLTGTFGIASTLSFYWSHQVSGIEGGAVLTDNDELADLCRMLIDHGLTRSLDPRPAGIDSLYSFRVFGYNLRPLEMHAAIALAQLGKLPELIEYRYKNLLEFVDLTANAGLPITFPRLNGRLSPFGIAFTVADNETRARLATALLEAGVDSRPPTGGSFARHHYGAPWSGQPTPNADRIHDVGMFLGNAPYPIPELIERAVEVMKRTLL